jgi:hypothetical protein
MGSFAQNHREDIRKELFVRFVDCHRLINITAQFDTDDMGMALILCRRLKERFMRVIHKQRNINIPFVGCVEVKGHLHTHLLSVLPEDMCVEDVDKRMAYIFRNTRGLKRDYNQYSISEDGDFEWKQYITKFQDYGDEVVWL